MEVVGQGRRPPPMQGDRPSPKGAYPPPLVHLGRTSHFPVEHAMEIGLLYLVFCKLFCFLHNCAFCIIMQFTSVSQFFSNSIYYQLVLIKYNQDISQPIKFRTRLCSDFPISVNSTTEQVAPNSTKIDVLAKFDVQNVVVKLVFRNYEFLRNDPKQAKLRLN